MIHEYSKTVEILFQSLAMSKVSHARDIPNRNSLGGARVEQKGNAKLITKRALSGLLKGKLN